MEIFTLLTEDKGHYCQSSQYKMSLNNIYSKNKIIFGMNKWSCWNLNIKMKSNTVSHLQNVHYLFCYEKSIMPRAAWTTQEICFPKNPCYGFKYSHLFHSGQPNVYVLVSLIEGLFSNCSLLKHKMVWSNQVQRGLTVYITWANRLLNTVLLHRSFIL